VDVADPIDSDELAERDLVGESGDQGGWAEWVVLTGKEKHRAGLLAACDRLMSPPAAMMVRRALDSLRVIARAFSSP
jgi:hypothetical protein